MILGKTFYLVITSALNKLKLFPPCSSKLVLQLNTFKHLGPIGYFFVQEAALVNL